MSNQLLQKQRTLYDWAESEGWSELRYDERDMVWRGFAPGSYIEEEVPIEILIDLLPMKYALSIQRVKENLFWTEAYVYRLTSAEGLQWGETNDAKKVLEFMRQNIQLAGKLAIARQEWAIECQRVAFYLAVKYGLKD